MRVLSTLRAIVGLGVGGALAAACASVPPATAPASLSSKSDRYRIAYEIAAARCDRQTPECESRAGVHYASRDACIAAKLPPSVTEADLDLCASYPLRGHDLDECLAEIRSGRCGTGLTGASACRGKNLCPWDAFAR